jgi:hypothetical protein
VGWAAWRLRSARVNDVDLAFYDPLDLSHAREVELERALAAHLRGVTWDANKKLASTVVVYGRAEQA